MEIFDSLTNILSLLFGGSLISVITWKFARRKAAAEAKQAEAAARQAEAEAKKAEAEALLEKQNYYQQMAEDLSKDRDYYKQDRDEQRDRLDKLTRSMTEWKRLTDQTIDDLRRQVSRNGRQLEAIRPFVCADLKCKKRVRVTTLENVETKEEVGNDIDPVENSVI